MPCYRPLGAWRTSGGGVTFTASAGFLDRPINLPCGQCIGCRLERSRQWAVRAMHEASMHESNCFVTLTYATPPPGGTLDRAAFPTFIRRVRKQNPGVPIKYFHCGEYGELLQRPHYHALIFGYDFPDKTHWKTSPDGHAQYRSPMLEKLWPLGYSTIGPVTFETAAYTARYCTKKVTGPAAELHYGELTPEYMTCSKGIGASWLQRYGDETYRDDSVVTRGHEAKPPRYYDKVRKDQSPEDFRRVQLDRLVNGNSSRARHERSPDRLHVRETVTAAELGLYKRDYA